MALRTRLAVAAGVILVVLVAIGVLLPRSVRTAQLEQVDRQLETSLPALGGLASGPRGPLGTNAAPRGPASTALSDVYLARLSVDGQREVLIRPQAISDREPQLPNQTSTIEDGINAVTVDSTSGAGSWRGVLIALPAGGQVLMAVSLDRVDATVQRVSTVVLLAGGVVLVTMAAAGWWLLRLGLRPIAEVTKVAGAIAAGERNRRARTTRPGTEAAKLADAFNVMLDDQQEGEQRLRRFFADASHELRTPVAAIGGFADLWRQGGIDEPQLGDVMRRIGQESARMRSLVEDMLLLAQLDDGRAVTDGPVDLTAIARDAALDASATHPSRHVTVRGVDSALVRGDEHRLRQVVSNLVTNALTHTDGPVTIDVTRSSREGGDVVLTVSDHGPGLPPAAAARVFDRFWRARRAPVGTGSGLGLPIVRSIVEAHHGRVTFASDPHAGTIVTVTLPASPAAQPQS
jgi:two-component system OmpR family sensor kinase